MRLGKLPPRVPTLNARRVPVSEGHKTRARRTTGRKLQDRRLKLWTKDPRCAMCRRITLFPDGFELDHIVPMFKGGDDTEANCQILCSGPDGCHGRKTKQDLSGGFSHVELDL